MNGIISRVWFFKITSSVGTFLAVIFPIVIKSKNNSYHDELYCLIVISVQSKHQ